MTNPRPVAYAHLTELEFADLLGVRQAGVGTRALAFLIDVIAWLILVTPALIGAVLLVTGGSRGWGIALLVAGAALSSIFVVILTVLHGRRGVTLGKALTKLRSVSATTLGRPGFWRIVLRGLLLWVSGIIPVIGPAVMLASPLWSERGRGILDRVANCWLVDVKAGVDPLNEQQMRRARRTLFAPKRDVSEHLPSLATGSLAEVRRMPPRSAAGIVGASKTTWHTNVPETEQGTPVLVFDDSVVITVPTIGVLGRAPDTPAGVSGAELFRLEDSARQLSKSHLAFGTDAEGVWIEDLHSSNGTTVQSADSQVTLLTAGVRTRVSHGDVVSIGGRAFRVVERGGSA